MQLSLDLPGGEENIISPENFTDKFLSLAAKRQYADDPVEAARVILRRAGKENRRAILDIFKTKGCTNAETTRRYLMSLVQLSRGPVNPYNYIDRFVSLAADGRYKDDPVEAARELLRRADRRSREAVLASLKKKGCTDPETTRRYLKAVLKERSAEAGGAEIDKAQARGSGNTAGVPAGAVQEQPKADAEKTPFKSYGAWTDFNKRLTLSERKRLNTEASAVLAKNTKDISEAEAGVLRRYSGFGGIAADNERGVLYDYYTSPPIADLTWKLLQKITAGDFSGKKILEPSCGSGVFFETAPRGTLLTGVELDGRSARIAQILHPRADIINSSFEQFNLSEKRGGFDAVIGNIPFGDRTIQTSFLDMPEEQSLDRYFVNRSLDNVRESGVAALITAPGVLANTANEQWRLAINKKARFLGAVKLSNASFHHTHTSVQPDILFFRKYPDDIIRRLSALPDSEFMDTGLAGRTFIEGTYFNAYPHHIMGERSEGTGQWGNDEIKGAASPESIQNMLDVFSPQYEGSDRGIFDGLRAQYDLCEDAGASSSRLSLSEEEQKQAAAKELQAGQVKVEGGRVYILGGGHFWEAVQDRTAGGLLAEKLAGILAVSQSVRAVRRAWRNGADAAASQAQEEALLKLKEYEKKFRVYPCSDKDIRAFANARPAVRGIFEALAAPDSEILTSKDNLYRRPVQTFDGHNPAVAALTELRNKLLPASEETLLRFFPDTSDSLTAEMQRNPDIFLTPGGVWELREDFIAGNAWEKIDSLRAAADAAPGPAEKTKWEYGIAELEKAAGWTPIEEAAFSPHSSWIPEHAVNAWIADEDGLDRGRLLSGGRLARNEDDKWGLLITKTGVWEELNDEIVYYLNMQKQRSRYNDTQTFDDEHNERFKNYIANHARFRDELEQKYNRLFNAEIAGPVKTYPVSLAGWNSGEKNGGKTLRPHQWQTVHHLYRQGKGISALGTGFGKTLAGIGLLTLLRQEGKISRVWLQVPNNKVKDWEKEIKEAVPSLKTASIDPEEKGYGSRAYRYAKYHTIAGSRADIIIMPESAASEIQLSPDNDKLISARTALNYKAEKAGASSRAAARAEERGLKQAENGKTNRVISFEDFGCDALFVDEAHRYKNLFTSSLSRETGLNDGRQSAKAMSLFKKTEFIRDMNGGKNVFLFTATPLTNSPLEYFNMISFVAPEELNKFNIRTVDSFIKNFADIKQALSYDWKTGKLNTGRTLAGFKNLQSLQSLFFKYTDYQNDPSRVKIIKPLSANKPNVVPQDKKQSETLKAISDELARYQALDPDERQSQFPGQNFLTFYSKMRTASLDLELYDPQTFKGWNNPKLQELAQNAFHSYTQSNGGQVVFCDRVFSADLSFNLHDKIKKYLAEAGFKSSEIIIINGFTKSGGGQPESAVEKETARAVEEFNEGRYKAIIGTTACIGEGLNLQKNSAALHHFDIPFRPSDFIQRNGRIDRQGNTQQSVELHTYLAAGTIDNYSVNLVQKKADWIDQLLKTKSNVFTNPDSDSFIDPEEIMLALTEEWGGGKAQERRAELERVKARKEQDAWQDKCRSDLASLSLLRGAVTNYTGDKGRLPFQNRIRKIAAVEKLLLNNPAFKHPDLIESGEPFLYNRKEHIVIRKGDMLFQNGFQYTVKSLDFKKQEIVAEPLIKKRYTYGYAHEYFENEKRVAASDIKNDGAYFPQPSPSQRALLSSLHTLDFYRHDDTALKAACYQRHLQACRFNDLTVPVFSTDERGALCIENCRFVYRDPLNPFVPEDQRKILSALNKGLFINNGEQTYMPLLKACLPRLYEAVSLKLELMRPPFENTADNLKKNVVHFTRFPAFNGKPVDALNHLISLSTPEEKQAILQKLHSYGCTDPASTKQALSSWLQPARTAAVHTASITV
jgi:hypothetical protein